ITGMYKYTFFSLALFCCAPLSAVAGDIPQVADVEVVAQTGKTLHFYRDLVKGRVVAINFVYTGCSSVCPLLGANFARAQTLVGDAPNVAFVSVSIDPANDTPQRLEAWAAKFGAKPGWTLVTGAKADIDALAKSLGTTTADPTSHTPLVVIVDDVHGGAWQRLDGLTDPAALAKVLRADAARLAA